MPLTSGIYIITNVQQRNPVFLENRNDEESIRGHFKPENANEHSQAQWHWDVIDLKNGLHSIQNLRHRRYAYSGSRAGLNASVMGASEEQQWHIQATSGKGEYTIGAIDSPNFWMLPDKERRTPVELFDVPTDRKCWWTFTSVETGAPVNEDAAYGAYLFALKPLPILPFSPLRLDFIIIQQTSNDAISNASGMIAGACGRLVSLGRLRSDALCINVIEVTSVGSDILFERSYDVVTFENLRNLKGLDISWEECDGASALPTMAIRGLRENTTKIAILNLREDLFQQGGEAIIQIIDDLAEHDITLVLTPIQPTWERTFRDSVVFKELKKLPSEYRRFKQDAQFSDYVVNYIRMVALPRLKKHPELRYLICPNIPYIVEVLRCEDQHTRSAVVAAFSQLAEYPELRDVIFQTVSNIFEMFRGNSSEAEVAASALIKLAEHGRLRDVIGLGTKDLNGLTPLSLAASNGHEGVVGMMLAHPSVDVNTKDKDGKTPLSRAAVNGHGVVVRLLLAHPGANVNAKDKDGDSPLSMAAHHGREAVVCLLLAYIGVNVDTKCKHGWTPLLNAASNGHDTVVCLLLAHPGVDVNAKDKLGSTPLSLAASKGDSAVLRLLLAHPSVDVNTKDKDGKTPLSRAAFNGDDAVVRLLLAHPGANVNAKDKDGDSPLSMAAHHGREAVVCLLLAYIGVNVDAKCKHGWTPLLNAASNGHDTIVRLLLAHPGVDVNAEDKLGSTPLSLAASKGHSAVLRLLLAHPSVDVNTKDKDGKTPLSEAAGNGHSAVVMLLREKVKRIF